MLISEILEKVPSMTASENMANRLADRVRNIWLENRAAGINQWEENFYEDPDGITFLRGDSFPNLQGIDYIFKWWGGDEREGLEGLAGTLEVLWKVLDGGSISIYKSWIRFADRDFVLGSFPDEPRKREVNRAEFRKAFATWQKLYGVKD